MTTVTSVLPTSSTQILTVVGLCLLKFPMFLLKFNSTFTLSKGSQKAGHGGMTLALHFLGSTGKQVTEFEVSQSYEVRLL